MSGGLEEILVSGGWEEISVSGGWEEISVSGGGGRKSQCPPLNETLLYIYM